jgi:hypothetical protein
MSHVKSKQSSSAGAGKTPAYISHYGIRARRFREMIQWYADVFRAEVQHENEFLAFMTFDEEHHRLVIFEDPETVVRPATASGIDHVGYGVASFGDLVKTYERLKANGVTPFAQLNHRFTTFLLPRPGRQRSGIKRGQFPHEGRVQCFRQGRRDGGNWQPPFGYTFDPDELARLYHQGVTAQSLARIGIPD